MPTKKFAAPLRIAVVGLGRMGSIHAYHALELARETGICELVAVSTAFPAHADQFFRQTDTKIPVFPSIEELAAANVCDAAIIVTNTALHREHATLMLDAGQRIFLEKPLTGTLEGDREFSSYLEREHPRDVMLGFQRRFDAPLLFAKQLLDSGRIGRLFKIYSALEDSAPAPNGFNSTGLLADMGIHNIDEILWLSGRTPRSAAVVGSRIYSHRLTTCQEDFDDAMLLLDFDGDPGTEMIGEVQVGRNHVAGYRGETVLYGEEGQICVGRFDGDPRKVNVEVYRRRGSPAFSKSFATRNYNEPLPEFVDRFGAAYKDELRIFIQCCLDGSEFPTRHLDALRAQEIIEAGMSAIVSRASMAEIRYANPVSFRNL
jgi:myo-inositol 2-dehydrogenase/D-chiro-inositol 1-dehydrogenase